MGGDDRVISRDEMNLAEWPLGLLTDDAPEGVTSLTFEGERGRLVVSGGDLGLPKPVDTDVILALLYVTKEANDFTEPVLHFSMYELMKVLGWADTGQSYRRLANSLQRWGQVSLRFENAWWDNAKGKKCRRTITIHVFDKVKTYDAGEHPASITWNDDVFKSFQAGNLKRIDLTAYFALGRPISKRLYRFLDRRLHNGPLTIDLHTLACGHLGLSKNYAATKIKEKIAPAIAELVQAGHLEPAEKGGRYTKTGHGRWNANFARPQPEPETIPTGLTAELMEKGVTRDVAEELVRDHPAGQIRANLAYVAGKRRPPQSIGYLVKAIRQNYAGWKVPTETTPVPDPATDDDPGQRWLDANQERILEVNAEALASADPTERDRYEAMPDGWKKTALLLAIRERYAAERAGAGG